MLPVRIWNFWFPSRTDHSGLLFSVYGILDGVWIIGLCSSQCLIPFIFSMDGLHMKRKKIFFSFFYAFRSSCQCFLNFILLLLLQSQPSLFESLDTIVTKTYLQVVAHDCWGKALIEELDPLAENHTWDIWVFSSRSWMDQLYIGIFCKLKSDSSLDRYKVTLLHYGTKNMTLTRGDICGDHKDNYCSYSIYYS